MRAILLCVVLAAALGGTAAHGFATFAIESVYSNADGTIQFVVLREKAGQSGQDSWAGKTLTMTRPGIVRTFTFPGNLAAPSTANKRVLLATAGAQSLGLVAPDYLLPERFLATDGGTLDFAGADQVAYGPLPTDGADALDRNGARIANVATNFAGQSASMPSLAVTAIEWRHATLDHYFISDRAPDIDALDSGRIAGWSRTGQSFKVHPRAGASTSPVCRFYIPPQHGDSHFFSASPAECSTISAKASTDPNYSGYTLETSEMFFVSLPDATSGECPASTVRLYRLWNQRADSNHRYTTSAALKGQMTASGYVSEGYGPDAVAMCVPPGSATLKLVAGETAPYGVLIRDGSSTPSQAYAGFTMATDSTNVGPRDGMGEVIAFGVDRPVAVHSASFSTMLADQTLSVAFAPPIEVPVTIWVLAAPFSTQQQTALALWQTAQALFMDERVGIRMSSLEIVDATGNPNASTWSAFSCGASNANVAAVQTAIGARPNRINVYLVSLVDGSTSRGNACNVGGGFVAIAAGAGSELLSHELGHDLALEHVDDLAADFDATNIMHSASNVRQFLTEGQLFRAHVRPNSALNLVYGARPGLAIRNCDRDTLTIDCPPIRKRLWADGTFPPN